METWEIQVYGDVQSVGYRPTVRAIAKKLGIKGFVKNDGENEEQVIIVATGEISNLEKFVSLIKIKEEPLSVENVEHKKVEFKEFKSFLVIRGKFEDEMIERMDVAGIYLRNVLGLQKDTLGLQKDTLGLQKDTLGLQNETLGLQKDTLGLQNETLGLQKDTLGLQKETLGLQKETLSAINNMNENMTKRFDVMEEKYGAISKTLGRIADALEKLVGKST